MIKVMIVDDSPFIRRIFKNIVEHDKELTVIATAKDGQDALEKIQENRPDVITLDIDMPVKNGLETLKEIMKMEKPIPTIMVSALDNRETVMKALDLGAFDFIPKTEQFPSTDTSSLSNTLIPKIKAAAQIEPKIPSYDIKPISPIKDKISKKDLKSKFPIVAIGTSSGGPKALKAILPVIPADFPAAILIVQHMPAGFTKSFADRLNQESAIKVKEAAEGDIIQPGLALLAPGDYHMQIDKDGRVRLDQTPTVWGVRPCVDHLFKSLAKNFKDRVIGIIMTGMGKDGAEGMKAVKKHGGYGIVESEETALVYGMPGAAIKANAYDEILPLHQIPEQLIKLIERRLQ
ncbi:MAG: chemotaxis response regulator protein-glutamate methylesterase [Halanaerobiaceae bacterium]|nr:chemotaxis response regulator protein-glutamate methylesterase [Halanaerobiaceae bacterium]